MAGQQGQLKYGFGWPDGRLGGIFKMRELSNKSFCPRVVP